MPADRNRQPSGRSSRTAPRASIALTATAVCAGLAVPATGVPAPFDAALAAPLHYAQRVSAVSAEPSPQSAQSASLPAQRNLGDAPAAPPAPDVTFAPLVSRPTTRIVDTQNDLGLNGALRNDQVARLRITGRIAADVQRGDDIEQTEQVVVPEGAEAVVLTMTAVDAAKPGYFTAWTANADKPHTSNVNFRSGETVTNTVTVPLNDTGEISIFTRGQADLRVDVHGYYRDSTYMAVGARRVHDSRTSIGQVTAGSVTHIDTGAEKGDLLTLTFTTDSAQAPGTFNVWGTAVDEADTLKEPPVSAALSYAPDTIVSNTTYVTAGDGGQVSVYSAAAATLIVDLTSIVPAAYADDVAVIFDQPRRTFDSREQPDKSPNDGGAKVGRRTHGESANAGGLSWLSARDAITGLHDNGAERNADAVIVTVTVIDPEANGSLTLLPHLPFDSEPLSATATFGARERRTRTTVVPLDLLGHVSAYADASVDIVVDVVGFIPRDASTLDDATLDDESSLGSAHGDPQAHPHTLHVDVSRAQFVRTLTPRDGADDTVDMTGKLTLQASAVDPDGNGRRDWVFYGAPGVLSNSAHVDVGLAPVLNGPTINAEPTVRIQYRGAPTSWRGSAADGGGADQAVSELRVPMRNEVTGELADYVLHIVGHYSDQVVGDTSRGAAGADGGLVVALPAPTPGAVAMTGHDVLVPVTDHQQQVTVTLPQSFARRVESAVEVRSKNREAVARLNGDADAVAASVIATDADGDDAVTFSLPAVEEAYANASGLWNLWHAPRDGIVIAGRDADGHTISAEFELYRR